MKKIVLLIASALLAHLPAQDIYTDGPLATGSNVTTGDKILFRDVSVTSGAGKVKALTIGELVNVPGLFSSVPDGTFTLSKLAQSGATSGQVAKWNGSAWAPAADAGGVVDIAAVNAAIDDNPESTLRLLPVGNGADHFSRMANYSVDALVNGYKPPSILFFGDSMIGTAQSRIKPAVDAHLDTTSFGWLNPAVSGGAATEDDACVKWITGTTYALDNTGETVTFGDEVSFAVEGNTLKVYYLRQPGGGVFKIQSSLNGAAFADEAGYTTINTNGALAGVVVTIPKSNWRANWRIQCVHVSGGLVNVIGAGVWDTQRFGARVSIMANGSNAINNLDNASLTARAITDPILADLAPNIIVLSHLDGASVVTAQGVFQSNVNAGVLTGAGNGAPSWIVVGPPVGHSDLLDIDRKAQADAQRVLARTRDDAFFDNRQWAGTPAEALANGYLNPGDVHYTFKAQAKWVPELFRFMGLNYTLTGSFRRTSSFKPQGGPAIRPSKGTFSGTGTNIEIPGSLRLTGSTILEDTAGAASANDAASITYNNDAIVLAPALAGGFAVSNYVGEYLLTGSGSTDSAPIGNVGIHAAPVKEVVSSGLSLGYVTKTASYTLTKTDHTVHVTGGGPGVVLTLPLSVASGTTARNKGRIYVIVNDSANPVQMATSTSTRGSGVTNGTTSITFASNSVVPQPGETVTGTDIPANTVVVSASTTSAVLNQAATGSNTGITFTFSQSVDFAPPPSVAPNSSLKVQSTGTGWITADSTADNSTVRAAIATDPFAVRKSASVEPIASGVPFRSPEWRTNVPRRLDIITIGDSMSPDCVNLAHTYGRTGGWSGPVDSGNISGTTVNTDWGFVGGRNIALPVGATRRWGRYATSTFAGGELQFFRGNMFRMHYIVSASPSTLKLRTVLGLNKIVTAASVSGGVVTLTSNAHGLTSGGITVTNIGYSTGTNPNGEFTISSVTTNTISYSLPGGSGSYTTSASSHFVQAADVGSPITTSSGGAVGTVATATYTMPSTGGAGNFYRIDTVGLTGDSRILGMEVLASGGDNYRVLNMGLGGSYDSSWASIPQSSWASVFGTVLPHVVAFRAAPFQHIGGADFTTMMDRIRATMGDGCVLLLIGTSPTNAAPGTWADPAVPTSLDNAMKAYAAAYPQNVVFADIRSYWPSVSQMISAGLMAGDGVHLMPPGMAYQNALLDRYMGVLLANPEVNETYNTPIRSGLSNVVSVQRSGFASGAGMQFNGDISNADGVLNFGNTVSNGGGLGGNQSEIRLFGTSGNFRVESAFGFGRGPTNHTLLTGIRFNRTWAADFGTAQTAVQRDAMGQFESMSAGTTETVMSLTAPTGQSGVYLEGRADASLSASGTRLWNINSVGWANFVLPTFADDASSTFSSVSCSVTSGNPLVTLNAGNTTGYLPGMVVTGTGVGSDALGNPTIVITVNSATTFTMSSNANATNASTSLTVRLPANTLYKTAGGDVKTKL